MHLPLPRLLNDTRTTNRIACSSSRTSRPVVVAEQRSLQAILTLLASTLAAVVLMANVTAVTAADKIGVKVPDGFEVSLFADDDLAHDIYCMTIDSLGRVVVSGPGYIRILIDSDGDGSADRFQQFADGPKTGAQGMYFHGRDLLCVGDAGLIRYRDSNGDDRADGPPDVFLKLKTGSEHHAHSIQKGPDGWWYIITGNMAGITKNYATLPTSPIKYPQSGALIRLKPDLSGGEVVADGLRNAYDFSFNRQGDVFTYDSDGERDISLPWYRPTRVFHILPGSTAGWVSRSWKQPHYFLGMPPVVAAFGRGSPTGVVCYRHYQFPKQYDNALFVLDWTYGRVLAVPLESNDAIWNSKPFDFMTGVGQFGFAPTDVAVGPHGSLYVSVGGRGTRGGVFRVTYKDGKQQPTNSADSKTDAEKLAACLDAPQPLSSWSRHDWVPLAKEIGRQSFVTAARDEDLSANARIRAIEILTEHFDGLDEQTLKKIAKADSAEVRARAIWSHGRSHAARPNTDLVADYLNDDDPLVGRFALESLLGAENKSDFGKLIPGLARHLSGTHRFNRETAARVIPKLNDSDFQKLSLAASKLGWQAGLANTLGFLARKPGFNSYAHEISLLVLRNEHPVSLKLEAIRLIQLGLGDLGSAGKLPAVYDGYSSPIDLTKYERELDPIRIAAANIFPTGNHDLDFELSRLLAILTPYNPKLLEKLLAQITDDSHPVDDIHYLIVASRIPVDRTSKQEESIARALVNIEPKIVRRKLKQDTNWDDRFSEMYAEHVKRSPDLPVAIIKQPGFGRPGHIIFFSQLPREHLQTAIDAFVQTIQSDENYPWSNNVVFILGESTNPEHRLLIRKLFDEFSVRSSVLMVLSKKPDNEDRIKFVAGLDSSQLEVLSSCVDALMKLPSDERPAEQLALLRTARRLGSDKREFPLREKVVQLLRRNTGQNFGFVLGEKGHQPQTSVIARWTEWINNKWPDEAAAQFADSQKELSSLKERLAETDWSDGDVGRGEKLFVKRQCAQCHGGRRALGPDLAGAARRFSRADLFTAIVAPSRDVSPRYQTTLIETVEGKVYSGLIIYESIDGLLLRNSTNQTFRIEAEEIEFRRKLNTSLMPKGLLKDLESQDFSDLYSYIRSLGGNSPVVRASDGVSR